MVDGWCTGVVCMHDAFFFWESMHDAALMIVFSVHPLLLFFHLRICLLKPRHPSFFPINTWTNPPEDHKYSRLEEMDAYSVVGYFKGKNILITGSTGFLGKGRWWTADQYIQ